MIKNKIHITGRVKLKHFDKNGNLKEDTGWLYNTITYTGLAVISGLVGNVDSQTAFTYLALGTSNTAESASHTALQAEITDSGLERASATVTRETTSQTNDTLQFNKTFTATGSKTVNEVGIFNDASSGVMFARKLTGSKAMVSSDTLEITYQIIFS